MKIYKSREELMADIAEGSIGENVKQAMKIHEAYMERIGQPPNLFVFLDELKRKGIE